MDAEEYKAANLHLLLLTEMLEKLPLADMLAAQSIAEATCPVIDPTLYRDKGNAFHVDMERTRIMRKAQVALDNLRAAHTEREAVRS